MKTIYPNIVITSIAAFALWTGDAMVDAFIFHQGTFTDLLILNVTPHEIYTRSLMITALVIIGIILLKGSLQRARTRETLAESRETLLTVTEAAKDAIIMMDHKGNISFWNAAAKTIFGHDAHDAIGRELHGLLVPARHQEDYREGFRKFQESGEGPSIGKILELTALRKDGTEFPVELSLSSLPLKGKWFAVGVLRDITERKRSEDELRQHRAELERLVMERTEELHAANELLRTEIHDRARTEEELYRSESFLSTIFDSFHDPICIIDRTFTVVKFNDEYTRVKDRRPAELFGKKCYEVLHQRTETCEDCIIEKTFQSKDPCAKEKQVTLPDGSNVWVEIYTYPILDQAGTVSHVVEYSRDITDRKKNEEEKSQLIDRLNHLSTTDGLTGLFNRRALNDLLQHEINRATRFDTDLSLILCDVDKFKQINDSFGHTAGDRALQTIAGILQKTLRKSDVLGRYGGDEFMIILPETQITGAKSLAEKIRAAVAEHHLELPGSDRIALSISIGVASCCAPLEDIDTLVTLADKALYTSKHRGRNIVSAAQS